MANPLKGSLGGNSGIQMPQGGIFGLIQKYNEFRKSFGGTNEEARQQIQNMLNTGQMSQQQFDQCEGMARQLQGIFK